MLTTKTLFIVGALAIAINTLSQVRLDSTLDKINPHKFSAAVAKQADKMEKRLVKKSTKIIESLQRKEENSYREMLQGKDSLEAIASLENIRSKYVVILTKLKNPVPASSLKQYIPDLDSVSSALKFLDKFTPSEGITTALGKAEMLQGRFQQAHEIEGFIRERRGQLKQQLENLGLTRQIKKMNREIYYYSAQVREYKDCLRNLGKATRKALNLVRKTGIFQDFMKKNSLLASIFRVPGDGDVPMVLANTSCLQTRAQVNNLIRQDLRGSGIDPSHRFQQSVGSIEPEIRNLKDHISKSGGSSDDEMPDFKPNNQKVKPFFSRLEYGFSFQTQKAQFYFPKTGDFAVSIGYKINDRSIVGLGASYKLGFGTGWKNMKFSQQGVGLRSYLDCKLKGNIWMSGGFELNYRSVFKTIAQLKNYNAWQKSGLIGISKNYNLRKKLKGKMQLLWDFFSYEQVPRPPAILFRTGFDLK